MDDLDLPNAAHGFILRCHMHTHGSAASTRPPRQRCRASSPSSREPTGVPTGSVPSPATCNGAARRHTFLNPPNFPLVADKVRMVGDYVVFVVAETLAQAKDAAEAIAVDYKTLTAVATGPDAIAPEAPTIWEDNPDNICYFHTAGDAEAVDAAFAGAAHVFSQRLWINRVSANSMEPRGAIGVYDPFENRYTLYSGLQTPHRNRWDIAATSSTYPRRNCELSPTMSAAVSA